MDKNFYTYEYDQVIFETSSKHPENKTWNVYGINLISRQINGEMFYCLYNGHADITRMVNEKGELAEKYYYDEWGVETETLKYGDLTGDGKVNINDYTLIKQYALNESADLSHKQIIVSDLNGDGKVDVNDSNILKQIIVKAIKYCPADTNQDGFINEKNNIKYAGYFYDGETGLYYLNARFYDPETARFIQEDSCRGEINDPLSLNLYTYGQNNPISYYDPTGHSIKSIMNALKVAKTVVKSLVVPNAKKTTKITAKALVKSHSIKSSKALSNAFNEDWRSGIVQLKGSNTAGKNFASYSEGVASSLYGLGQGIKKLFSHPLTTINEAGSNFCRDPWKNNPIHGYFDYCLGLSQASYKGDWETVFSKIGQGTTTVAIVGTTAGLGQSAAGAIAPNGFNSGFGMSSVAATNGIKIGTGSLAVSVSASGVATAGAVASGTLAANGVVYSSSFNNNNLLDKNIGKSSNKASSGNSKTSQVNSNGGVNAKYEAGTGPYSKVGGHHVHAKAAFKGDMNYDPNKGFSLSQNI